MTSVNLLAFVALAFPLTAIAFAATFGRQAERLGAAISVTCLFLTWGAQLLGDRAPYLTFMAIDFLTAVAFGALMLRNPEKLWPGVAGCAQFLVFVFSATRALDFPLSESAYLCALNISGTVVLVALVLGTLITRWFPRQPSEWDLAAARI